MKSIEEIEIKLKEMKTRLVNQINIVEMDVINYYKGFIKALEWILLEEKEN